MPKSTQHALAPMCRSGFNISVGDYTYGVPGVRWAPDERTKWSLVIGKYCSIAADVDIYVGRQGRHTTDFLSTYPIGLVHGPIENPERSSAHQGQLDVEIGSDVWIGRGAQIMAGVKIGHGAVIGARSLVHSDIEPYAVAVGTPAKPIRLRFSPSQVADLLRLRWWDLPSDVLRANNRIFARSDIDDVISRLEALRTTIASQHDPMDGDNER